MVTSHLFQHPDISKCTLFNMVFFDIGIAQKVFKMVESGVWTNFDEQKMSAFYYSFTLNVINCVPNCT